MTISFTIPDLRTAYLLPYRGPTKDLYVFYLGRFLDWCVLDDLDPMAARPGDIERYVHHLHVELELKASTVCTAMTPVRGFYRFALPGGHRPRPSRLRTATQVSVGAE